MADHDEGAGDRFPEFSHHDPNFSRILYTGGNTDCIVGISWGLSPAPPCRDPPPPWQEAPVADQIYRKWRCGISGKIGFIQLNK